MPKLATAEKVGRAEVLDFVRERHHGTLVTTRSNGSLQISPVTCGLDEQGRVVISTYPERAKTRNARRQPQVSILIHSDDWDGPYVQLDGSAEVFDVPEGVEALVDYYRCIAGEHQDWDEYRTAMVDQGKSLLRVTIERWGPVATGGFPPARVASESS